MTNKAYRKKLLFIIQKTQTEMRYHFSTVILTNIKKKKIFITVKGWRKQDLILCCWE